MIDQCKRAYTFHMCFLRGVCLERYLYYYPNDKTRRVEMDNGFTLYEDTDKPAVIIDCSTYQNALDSLALLLGREEKNKYIEKGA